MRTEKPPSFEVNSFHVSFFASLFPHPGSKAINPTASSVILATHFIISSLILIKRTTDHLSRGKEVSAPKDGCQGSKELRPSSVEQTLFNLQ
jgi:hypothetical protein